MSSAYETSLGQKSAKPSIVSVDLIAQRKGSIKTMKKMRKEGKTLSHMNFEAG